MTENPQPKLLVVDDDPVTRARLDAYFSNEGYVVTAVHNGDEMWRVLRSETINIVLLDVGQ